MAMRTAYFEVFKGNGGWWYWRLRGRNGEIMCQSEGYASKGNAKRAAHRIAPAAKEADRINVVEP